MLRIDSPSCYCYIDENDVVVQLDGIMANDRDFEYRITSGLSKRRTRVTGVRGRQRLIFADPLPVRIYGLFRYSEWLCGQYPYVQEVHCVR